MSGCGSYVLLQSHKQTADAGTAGCVAKGSNYLAQLIFVTIFKWNIICVLDILIQMFIVPLISRTSLSSYDSLHLQKTHNLLITRTVYVNLFINIINVFITTILHWSP